MTDVVLVKTNASDKIYSQLNKFSAIEPPIWALMIASFLHNRGYSVEIIDAEILNLNINETIEKIIEALPKLVIFVVYGHQPSASTQCMPSSIAVHEKLKESSCQTKTLFMGTHPSALPIQTIKETGADFVCTGEGPDTIIGLLSNKDYDKIGSLCYCKDRVIETTKPSILIDDLNGTFLPLQWDLIPIKIYRAHNWHCLGSIERSPYASLYTSLGCPFKCSFCCINTPFGKPTIRYFNPKYIIKEIDKLVNKYGIYNIKIPDEMFVLNRNHVIELCDLIINRGYKLNIWAYARVDTIKDCFLEKLKLAGFRWLALGIESASKLVRDRASKAIKNKDIFKVVEKIKSYNINICGNYIFGLPDDTYESMNETLQLAIELNTEWSNFYCAMAYPGSELYQKSKEEKIFLPEDEGGPGWIGYSQHAYESFPLGNKTLSPTDILNFRDSAHQIFFSGEKYLNHIEKKFGIVDRKEIESINKVEITRKYG